jgi:hypothetical protein
MDEDEKAQQAFDRLLEEHPESEWAREIPKEVRS